MKLKIVIHGPKVHNVGYRYFLLNQADNLGLKGFSARNMKANGLQVVQIFVEGDENQVSEFQEISKDPQQHKDACKKRAADFDTSIFLEKMKKTMKM
jgi:acylphosphatase